MPMRYALYWQTDAVAKEFYDRGNILVLQGVPGHSGFTMTMRYAHFSPDHLEEAKKLNPLARVDNIWTMQQGNDLHD